MNFFNAKKWCRAGLFIAIIAVGGPSGGWCAMPRSDSANAEPSACRSAGTDSVSLDISASPEVDSEFNLSGGLASQLGAPLQVLDASGQTPGSFAPATGSVPSIAGHVTQNSVAASPADSQASTPETSVPSVGAQPALPQENNVTLQRARNYTQRLQKAVTELKRLQESAASTGDSTAPTDNAAAPVTTPAADEPQGQTAASAATERRELTLYQAEECALKNNPQIKSSEYSAMVSHEQLGLWLANIYPDISFSAGLSHSGVLATSSDSHTRSSSRINAGISISQTLLDFSRKHKLRRFELAEASSLASLETTRQTVLLNVRKAWFACYIDQTLLEIAQETVHNREIRLKEAERHYETGLKAKSDVVSAQADLASAQHDVVQAQTQLLLDWVDLNVAMGEPSSEPYYLVADPYWERVGDLDSRKLLETAMAHRSELLSSLIGFRSALTELESIRSGNLPSLRLSGNLGGSGSLSPFEGSWSIGLSLNWSIFDGYMQQYEEDSQAVRIRALAEDFANQRLSVYREVKSAEVVLRQSKASIDSAEAALASAQEKYRLASARYKAGVGDSVEVYDAELTLAQAETAKAKALNSLRVAKAAMIRVLGVDDMDNLPEVNEAFVLDPIPEMPELFDSGASQEKLKSEFPSLGGEEKE